MSVEAVEGKIVVDGKEIDLVPSEVPVVGCFFAQVSFASNHFIGDEITSEKGHKIISVCLNGEEIGKYKTTKRYLQIRSDFIYESDDHSFQDGGTKCEKVIGENNNNDT